MIAFEVIVNGEKIILAGIGDDGILASMITWVSKDEERPGMAHLTVTGI